MWRRHHDGVPVGVVDVGANTVRLLASAGGREVLSLRETIQLGESVERFGRIPDSKLAQVADCVGVFAGAARAHGVVALEVLVTSPGRQAANGHDLLEVLATAARAPARVLSAAEEGRLAFVGALTVAGVPARKRVAVVDVGGGSAQVAVGSRREGPDWIRSIDLGSMRLTSRLLPDDPPGREAVGAARAEVARYLEGLEPPLSQAAFAVGGSARALRRLFGSRLGKSELRRAVELLTATPAAELLDRYDLSPERVRTLPAGAVILEALQARLPTPLKVVRAGLRNGALLELAERQLAAASAA